MKRNTLDPAKLLPGIKLPGGVDKRSGITAQTKGIPYGRTNPTEHEEQVALIRRCDEHIPVYPKLKLRFAVINGVYIPGGSKLAGTIINKMIQEGMNPDTPDLTFPFGGWHKDRSMGYANHLYIELKTLTGYATKEQKIRHEELRAENNRVEVCKGCDAAWVVIMDYLAPAIKENGLSK